MMITVGSKLLSYKIFILQRILQVFLQGKATSTTQSNYDVWCSVLKRPQPEFTNPKLNGDGEKESHLIPRHKNILSDRGGFDAPSPRQARHLYLQNQMD